MFDRLETCVVFVIWFEYLNFWIFLILDWDQTDQTYNKLIKTVFCHTVGPKMSGGIVS